MSCRSTPYGSAYTSLARLNSGLTDVQMLSLYHSLRRTEDAGEPPTREAWNAYLDQSLADLPGNDNLTEARRRSIASRLEQSRDLIPDARSWAALQALDGRATRQQQAINNALDELRTRTGWSEDEVRRRYSEAAADVDHARDAAPPPSFTDETLQAHTIAGLPVDRETVHVLATLRAQADQAHAEHAASAPPRVERIAVDSSAIREAGYDPRGGHLEIVMHSNPEHPYYFRSVPPDVWQRMQDGSAGRVFATEVRGNRAYQYPTRADGERAAVAPRCENCGQFASASHTCPAGAPASLDGGHAAPALPDLDPVPAPVAAPAPAGDEDAEPVRASEASIAEAGARAATRPIGRTVEIVSAPGDIPERLSRPLGRFFMGPDPAAVRRAARAGIARVPISAAQDQDVALGWSVSVQGAFDLWQNDDGTWESEASPGNPLSCNCQAASERTTDCDHVRAVRRHALAIYVPRGGRVAPVRASRPVAEQDLQGRPAGREVTELEGVGRRPVALAGDITAQLPPSPYRVQVSTHSLPAVRRAARTGIARVPVRVDGLHSASEGHLIVQGSVDVWRNEDGTWGSGLADGRQLRCQCARYRANYDCEHVRGLARSIHAHFRPAPNLNAPATQDARTRLPEAAAGRPAIRVEPRGNRRVTASSAWGADPRLIGAVTRLPSAREVQSVAHRGAAVFPVSFEGTGHRTAHTGNFEQGGPWQVRGDAVLWRDDDDWQSSPRDLRCNCIEYRQNYDCEHVRAVSSRLTEAYTPAGQNAVRADLAQATAERLARFDWTRDDAGLAEARATWNEVPAEHSYSQTYESFAADVAEARARKARGEHPIEYQTTNALGGWCAPGSEQGFGVELEFDLTDLAYEDRHVAKQAIAQELYAAGLTAHDYQRHYHAGATTVHRQHARGWRYEEDQTVDGEIISPVMQDTPETWENIAKVCDIIKRHGGTATVKTGSHVHVSAPSLGGAEAAAMLHTVNQHEDVLYRLASNPAAGQHRPTRWCAPNQAIDPGTADLSRVRNHALGHHLGLNLQHVHGTAGDHPEFRHWDGSLDPAVIQAQIKMSVAMVEAARRNSHVPTNRQKEPLGTRHKRQRLLLGRSRRQLTFEEGREDSTTARSFIDTLFTRREDKKQIAALFAITQWTKR